MQRNRPYVFDIATGRTEDGPGIRTVVFLKGCPLRCVWCHNPESHSPEPDHLWDAAKCFACGRCEQSCPSKALYFCQGELVIDKSKCDNCARCQEVCPGGALLQAGTRYEADVLVHKLEQDKNFFDVSQGGVTFSGGEPLQYPVYIGEVTRKLQARHMQSCIETCGYFEYAAFREEVMPYIDCVLFDLKLMSDELHRKYTGRSNRLILENFRRLREDKVAVIPRTPLIPGITDTAENLEAIQEFLLEQGMAEQHVLLPYNPAGQTKYIRLR